MVSAYQPSGSEIEVWNRQQLLDYLRHEWQPGEHISLWGATGCGKTTVCAGLAHLRRYSAVLASKQEDKTLALYEDFKIIDDWKKRHWYETHVIVWPYAKQGQDVDVVFRRASLSMMEDIFWEKNWTFQIDDAKMMRHLGLMGKVKMLFAHMRSQHSSILYNDQRPFETIQEALDQTSYKIMFYMEDKRDVYRMAEASGKDPRRLLAANNQLRRYEFLFLPKWGNPILVRE